LCILVANFCVFLIAKNCVLLFTDYNPEPMDRILLFFEGLDTHAVMRCRAIYGFNPKTAEYRINPDCDIYDLRNYLEFETADMNEENMELQYQPQANMLLQGSILSIIITVL
jgi:hypothetical protein